MFHTHKWGPIENGYQTCSKCGETKNIPCAHNFTSDPMNEDYIVCMYCGQLQIKPCSHKWDETSRETVSRGGRRIGHIVYLKCTKCGTVSHKELTI